MSDIASAFVRQRRSLMIVSFVLSVVLVFGIDGSKMRLSPGGGGVTVDIGDPQLIVYGLWVAWVWFLYRYWQHFRVARKEDLKSLIAEQRNPISATYSEYLRRLIEEKQREHGFEEYKKAEQINVLAFEFRNIPQRSGLLRVTATGRCQRSAIIAPNKSATLHPTDLSATSGFFVSLWKTPRAILPVNLKHRYFTEYWTAFAFAAAPVLVMVWRLLD